MLLDVHSYPSRALPYELHADGPARTSASAPTPSHTAGGWWRRPREAFAEVGSIALDEPVRGHATFRSRTIAADLRVLSLMLEIRRDAYLVEPAGPLTAGAEAVVAALARLVDAVSAGAPR